MNFRWKRVVFYLELLVTTVLGTDVVESLE